MLTRSVHARLGLLGLFVVLTAVAVGVLVHQRAAAQADSLSQRADLVAAGLDDQALVVALQNERWQQLRGDDPEGAMAATDALIAVREFDARTLESVAAARSSDTAGGYQQAIQQLLDRSGHVDPNLLDGTDGALATVNADLLRWREALIAELEAVIGRGPVADVDQVRGTTGEWATTLRLSAAPGQADRLEAATGTARLTEIREAIDGVPAPDRGAEASRAWAQAHADTAAIVADADAEIWQRLVASRDDAGLRAQLAPLAVLAGALAVLLCLVWVGRRWPATPVAHPEELGLELLVSTDNEAEAPPSDDSEGSPPSDLGDHDAAPEDVDRRPETSTVAAEVGRRESALDPQDEPIFVGVTPAVDSDLQSPPVRRFTDIFTETPERETVDDPGDASTGADDLTTILATAGAMCIRPVDVEIESIDPGAIDRPVSAAVTQMVTALLDTALAHATPDAPVVLIGASHELGYLVWVINESGRIDEDGRRRLNGALGGDVAPGDRSTLLRRLAEIGARAGETGVDIELLADDRDGNLARLFVPARHLVESPAPLASGPDERPDDDDADASTDIHPDPLATVTAERLSARLTKRRQGRPSAPRREAVADAPCDQTAPVVPVTVAPTPERASWPSVDRSSAVLVDRTLPAGLSEGERRAAAAQRLVEQYRGGVGAALIDGADDIVLVRRTEESP